MIGRLTPQERIRIAKNLFKKARVRPTNVHMTMSLYIK